MNVKIHIDISTRKPAQYFNIIIIVFLKVINNSYYNRRNHYSIPTYNILFIFRATYFPIRTSNWHHFLLNVDCVKYNVAYYEISLKLVDTQKVIILN